MSKKRIISQIKAQRALAEKMPLKNVPIKEALAKMQEMAKKEPNSHIMKPDFRVAMADLIRHHVNASAINNDDLDATFDAVDYDSSGALSRGEWSVGLCIFFKGTVEEKDRACFEVLDADGNASVDKAEMAEYVRPIVNAMVPPDAAVLKPMLCDHVAQTIFDKMDYDDDHKVTIEEWNRWRSNRNNVVDQTADVISTTVYAAWSKSKSRGGGGLTLTPPPTQARDAAPATAKAAPAH